MALAVRAVQAVAALLAEQMAAVVLVVMPARVAMALQVTRAPMMFLFRQVVMVVAAVTVAPRASRALAVQLVRAA